MRDVRMMQNHLLIRHDHCPVLSAAGVGGGYWIADNAGETAAFFESFRKRALTGFVKASRGRKAVAVDLAVQMVIEFDGLVSDEPIEDGPAAQAAMEQSTAASLAERVIERMLASPQRFRGGSGAAARPLRGGAGAQGQGDRDPRAGAAAAGTGGGDLMAANRETERLARQLLVAGDDGFQAALSHFDRPWDVALLRCALEIERADMFARRGRIEAIEAAMRRAGEGGKQERTGVAKCNL